MNWRPPILTAVLLLSSLWAMAQWPPLPPPMPDPVKEMIENPYSQYYTRKDVERIVREMDEDRRRGSVMVKGKIITIDTRDQESCHIVQSQLEDTPGLRGVVDPRHLCDQDPQNPMGW